MSSRIDWTAAADAALLQMRGAGWSWPNIALQLKIGRNSVIERARALGLPPRLPELPPIGAVVMLKIEDRAPLPAGHPVTWQAITQATVLQGLPYPHPVLE